MSEAPTRNLDLVLDTQPMSPSRRRAPRVGAPITVAALFLVLAASVSPFVQSASATDPTGDPGPTPTVAPSDPVATDPGPTDPPPADPVPTDPAPTDPAPTDPAPTDAVPTDPGTTPAPDPAPSPSDGGPAPVTPDPGASDAPSNPGDEFPLYPLVLPGSEPLTVDELLALLPAPGAALGPSPFTTPHIELSLTGDTCAACHRAHTAQGRALANQAAPQAGLCFSCHDGSGSILAVEGSFTAPANDPATSSYYAHPATVDLTHVPGGDVFGGRLERHATCADCHDPHNSTGSLATPSGAGWTASGATVGATGVSVVNGPALAAPAYTLVRNVSFEYELCLKCHSGYTQLPAQDPAKPSTWALDKGIELNPANGSYHPIEAAGTNQSNAMAASLLGGTLWQFGLGDTVRCVNCHGDPTNATATDPASRLGLHGSTERGMLIAPYRDRLLKPAGEGYLGTNFTLCFLCHDPTPFTDGTSTATNFNLHARHLTGIGGTGSNDPSIDVAGAGQGNAICAECHFRLHSTALAVKPGDVNNARLVNFAPNVVANAGNLVWVGGQSASCTLTCHGVAHNAEGYAPLANASSADWVGARISISSSGTIRVGEPHTFVVTVEEETGVGFGPADGIAVTVTEDGVGEIDLDASTCDDSPTDANGRCLVVVTSSVTGESTVNATATVTVVVARSSIPTTVDPSADAAAGPADGTDAPPAAGVVDSPVATDPPAALEPTAEPGPEAPPAGDGTAGTVTPVAANGVAAELEVDVDSAGYGAQSIENSVTWVDARISVTGAGAGPGGGEAFVVTVEQDTGAGFGPAPGTGVGATASGGAIDPDASTCDDGGTDEQGQCLVVVLPDDGGTPSVRATAFVVVNGVRGSVGVFAETATDAPAATEPAAGPAVVEEVFLDIAPDGGRSGPLVG